jgi:Carboxypeptidase regulatory-like domain
MSALVAGLLLTSLGSSVASQSLTTGAITGTVIDSSRTAIPAVVVSARNSDTNREASATTDTEGRFGIVGLQPGHYLVEVSAPDGSAVATATAVVGLGRTTSVNLSLAAVTVIREASKRVPIVNAAGQDFSVSLTQTSFDDLPNNGRRWSNFAILAPATAPDPFGGVSFRGVSSLLNGNSIDGADNDQAFLSSERGGPRIGYAIGLASISEVQIKVSNSSAEYGRAAGGMVNAITKSGTNSFHGSAFLYDRDNRWGARNPRGFESVLIEGVPSLHALKPVDSRYQFGGTVGGPFLENRLFFFGSYDQQRRNFPAISTTSDPGFFRTVDRGVTGGGLKAPGRELSDAQIDSTLAFLNGLTGEVARRGDQTIYTPRIDWHLTNRHALSATYNRLRWKSPAGFDTAPTSNRGRTSFGDDFVDIDWLTIGLLSRIGSRLVNELRSQFSRDHEFAFSQTPAPGEPQTGLHGRPPAISITGGINFGKPADLDRRALPDERRWQYADTLTLTLRDHVIQAGASFDRVTSRRDLLPAEEGNYNYQTLNDFIIDYANFRAAGALRAAGSLCSTSTRVAGQCYSGNYGQSFGRAVFEFTTSDYSFFVQDDFRLSSRTILNLVLRVEYRHLPRAQASSELSNLSGQAIGPEQTRVFPSDRNNFEPRLGFVYDVQGTGKTMLRGGYGLYHGWIPGAIIADAISRTGTAQSQSLFQLNPAGNASAAPVFPSTLADPPSAATPPNLVVFDPEMQWPSIHQFDLIFERALGSSAVFSSAYLFSAGHDLPTFVDVNLPAPTSRTYEIIGSDFNGQRVTVSPFFGGSRPDSRFGIITAIGSLIESDYHAFVVHLNRRLAKTLQFDSSYTLSKASDNGQSSTSFISPNYPSNPLDVSADQGRSDFDTRHKFTAAAVWSPPPASNHGLARAMFSGITISTVFFAKSGEPYSAGVGGSPAGGLRMGIAGTGSPRLGRFPLIPRNAFRLPKIVNLDLRLSRRFHVSDKANLEILGEAFNVFNRTQVTALNTRMYLIDGTATASLLKFDPSFGTVSAAGNDVIRERQLQFAIRMTF